jgi:hypothetical protein
MTEALLPTLVRHEWTPWLYEVRWCGKRKWNFILHSQNLTSFGRCYLFTNQCSYYSVVSFFYIILVMFCVIINLWQCFCGNRSSLWFIYLVINGNMAISCDHHCVIEKILQTSFSSLSYDDKLEIIEAGLPKPNLNLYTNIKNLHSEKLRGMSPRANYTHRVTAACLRS